MKPNAAERIQATRFPEWTRRPCFFLRRLDTRTRDRYGPTPYRPAAPFISCASGRPTITGGPCIFSTRSFFTSWLVTENRRARGGAAARTSNGEAEADGLSRHYHISGGHSGEKRRLGVVDS